MSCSINRAIANCSIALLQTWRDGALFAILDAGPGRSRDAGVDVFGVDLSPAMVGEARRLNPDIAFRVGDMLALDVPDGSLAGVVAFYAIVNIPEPSLLQVFQETYRVLQPGGLALIAFHIGDQIIQERELFGRPISMDFFFFQPPAIAERMIEAGFSIEEIVEREPYAPGVEFQSRRAHVFARKSF
jgi:SAM-dependent methyltransferase